MGLRGVFLFLRLLRDVNALGFLVQMYMLFRAAAEVLRATVCMVGDLGFAHLFADFSRKSFVQLAPKRFLLRVR